MQNYSLVDVHAFEGVVKMAKKYGVQRFTVLLGRIRIQTGFIVRMWVALPITAPVARPSRRC